MTLLLGEPWGCASSGSRTRAFVEVGASVRGTMGRWSTWTVRREARSSRRAVAHCNREGPKLAGRCGQVLTSLGVALGGAHDAGDAGGHVDDLAGHAALGGGLGLGRVHVERRRALQGGGARSRGLQAECAACGPCMQRPHTLVGAALPRSVPEAGTAHTRACMWAGQQRLAGWQQCRVAPHTPPTGTTGPPRTLGM